MNKQQQVRQDLSDALYALAQGRAAWAKDGCGGRGSAVSPGAWLSVACGGDNGRLVRAMHALDDLLPGRTFAAWARAAELEEVMNLLERALLMICPACGGPCSTQEDTCDDCRAAWDAALEQRIYDLGEPDFTDVDRMLRR